MSGGPHEASGSSFGSPFICCPFSQRSSNFNPAHSASTLLSPWPPSPPPPLKAGRVLPVVPIPPDAAPPQCPVRQGQSAFPSAVLGPELEELPPLEVEVPPLWCLARHYWSWLLLPAGLLLLALPALYFAERLDSSCSVLAVFVAVQLLTMVYFLVRLVCHSQSLLQLLEGKADLLCGCAPEQVPSIVSGDERVRFLQLALYHRHADRAAPHVDTSSSVAGDPLHFLALDLAARAKSEDGHCVVTTAGTILWCNDALATHFGYSVTELLAENVRRLMPPPYNTVHDALMRKYDRESTTKRVVGCTRTVPVVDRAGVQSTVYLSMEERIDPTDEANALFLAKMVFPCGPSLLDLVQERMWTGLSAAAECRHLQEHAENFLVTDACGEILFASDGLVSLLGWPSHGLEGRNLSVLMSPDTGKVHVEYMCRYAQRAAAPHPRPPHWPASSVVGTGRDLYARRRDGQYLRAWVTVHRLDAPSGRPAEGRFLGTVLYMQAPEDLRQSLVRQFYECSSHSRSSRGPAAAVSQGLTNHSLDQPARKRCTVLTFDIYGLLDLPDLEMGIVYDTFLKLLATTCHKHNAQLQAPAGDRVLVTLNVSVPNLAQRTAAAAVLQHVTEEWGRSGCALATPVYCAAVHAPALCAMYGRTAVMLGEAVDLCACLVRVAAEAHAQHGLIDAALYDELQYAYECRPVNRVTLWPKQPNARSVMVYELYSLKEVDEDEWMYQIEPRQTANPLTNWRKCWDLLEGAPPKTPLRGWLSVAAPHDDALDCLEAHLEHHPHDPTAEWLQRVLLAPEGTAEATQSVDVAGKIPYIVHYHSAAASPFLAPAARGPPVQAVRRA